MGRSGDIEPLEFSRVQGDTYPELLRCRNRRTKAIVDVSGATAARFTVKRHHSDIQDDAVIAKTLADDISLYTDGTDGIFSVAFAAADTEDLQTDVAYVFDLEVTLADGVHTTVGTLRMVPEVSTALST